MAVSSGNTEVKTVLEISTGDSPKSIKDLRNQIKELRDELVTLDKGSQEYADTLSMLGNKTNDLRELMGDISRTTTDFGTTVSNVSNVMAGGVAAVQGLTAGLSLLGVNMGEDDKLTQTLIKSMALLQSLGTMDKAIKSFRALSVLIKSNIAAAGGLGKALKALAISNPFTAILAGATAVVGVVGSIVSKQKELAQAEKEAADAAREQAIEWTKLRNELTSTGETIQSVMEFQKTGLLDQVKYGTELREEIRQIAAEYQNAHPHDQQAKSTAWMYAFRNAYEAAIKSGDKYKAFLISLSEIEFDLQRDAQGNIKQTQENYALLQKAASAWEKYTGRNKKNSKQERDLEKEKYELAKKRLDLQRQLASNELEANYQAEIAAAQGNADELLRIDREYTEKRTQLNRQYYTDAIALAENFKKTRKKEADIVAVEADIAKMNESLANGEYAWAEYNREQEQARKEKELTRQELQAEIAALDQEAERITRNSTMQNTFNQETIDYMNKMYDMWGPLATSMTTYYEAERQYQEQLLSLENQHNDLIEDRGNLDARLEQLRSQYEQQLITYDEYEKQKAEIRQQYADVQAQIDENEVEQEKTKLERKKQLNEAYRSAINNITGDLVGLLNSMADAEGVSFEESKKMKIAAATISTIQGGINAFMGYLDSGIPQPYASILGAAAAAATVAMGMMEIQKIKAMKPGSSSAAASSGAVQVVTTPPQIVNLNQDNLDQIELPETRVYVLESDITDAQNRVQVVENNSLI